jgi:hypothetical protein
MAQESSSILEALQSQLSGDTVQTISQRIGADPAQTQQAINAALPMLLAALGKEAADPERSAGLKQAIQQDHDGAVVDNLPAYLSGEMTGRATYGDGIIHHVLGDRQEPAVRALSGKSGLDLGSIASLLPLLAPIVMGMIGKKERTGGISLDNISDVLGSDTQRARNDQPDIGDLLGTVLGGAGQGQGGGIGDLLGSLFGKR